MARPSSVAGGVHNDEYYFRADAEVDELREAIWSAVHQEKGSLSWSDVSFALGIVQYELMHHSDEYEE